MDKQVYQQRYHEAGIIINLIKKLNKIELNLILSISLILNFIISLFELNTEIKINFLFIVLILIVFFQNSTNFVQIINKIILIISVILLQKFYGIIIHSDNLTHLYSLYMPNTINTWNIYPIWTINTIKIFFNGLNNLFIFDQVNYIWFYILIQDICNKIDKKFKINYSQYVLLFPIFWPIVKILILVWPFGLAFYFIFHFFILLKQDNNSTNMLHILFILIASNISHPGFFILTIIIGIAYFNKLQIFFCLFVIIVIIFTNNFTSQYVSYFDVQNFIWVILILSSLAIIADYFKINKEISFFTFILVAGLILIIQEDFIAARIVYVALIIVFLKFFELKTNFIYLISVIFISISYAILSNLVLFDSYFDGYSKKCWLEYTKNNKVKIINEFRIFSTFDKNNRRVELLEIYKFPRQENTKLKLGVEREIYIYYRDQRKINLLSKWIWKNSHEVKFYNLSLTFGKIVCVNDRFIIYERYISS